MKGYIGQMYKYFANSFYFVFKDSPLDNGVYMTVYKHKNRYFGMCCSILGDDFYQGEATKMCDQKFIKRAFENVTI